jgi:hypothetical protein
MSNALLQVVPQAKTSHVYMSTTTTTTTTTTTESATTSASNNINNKVNREQ